MLFFGLFSSFGAKKFFDVFSPLQPTTTIHWSHQLTPPTTIETPHCRHPLLPSTIVGGLTVMGVGGSRGSGCGLWKWVGWQWWVSVVAVVVGVDCDSECGPGMNISSSLEFEINFQQMRRKNQWKLTNHINLEVETARDVHACLWPLCQC